MRRKAIVLYSIALAIFSIGFCSSAFCRVLYVNSGVQVSGIGISWSTAIKDLSKAVDLSTDGDEIWVREGNYEVSEGPLLVNKSVKIYGGFPPQDVNVDPDMGDRDWETYETTIEPLYRNNPPSHLLEIRNRSATIDGFHINNGGNLYNDGGGIWVLGCAPTIKNCVFNGNKAIAGGAIAIFNSSPNIKQCIFKNNRADYGGAIYNSNSKPFISNCMFIDNSAWFGGGAIYNEPEIDSSEINCEDSIFSGNKAVNGSGGAIFEGTKNDENYQKPGGTYKNCQFDHNSAKEDGGAIRSVGTEELNIEKCTFKFNESNSGGAIFAYDNVPSTLEDILDYITDSAFSSNIAHSEGGAIVESGRIEVSGCIFFNNHAGPTEGYGGAINFVRPSVLYPYSGSYAVKNSVFNLNTADFGGAISNKGVDTEFLSCKFNRNEVNLRGGAIYCEDKDDSNSGPRLLNCTFAYNVSAEDGGAIFIDGVDFISIHNTFYNNHCNYYGGAIRFIGSTFPGTIDLFIANSILWGNRSIILSPDYKEISIPEDMPLGYYIYYNDIDQTNLSEGIAFDNGTNIMTDPRILYDAISGSLHLRRGSPCMDKGSNTHVNHGLELPENDFEGDPRIVNEFPDMGADELLLKVPIDIIPQICPNTYNVEDPTNLTMAIIGDYGFDINSIDRDSIELTFEDIVITNVINIKVKNVGRPSYPYGECRCKFGKDRFNDLIFEIDPDEISDFLPSDIEVGDELVLSISGLLKDGTAFTGKDCIYLSVGEP
jgi:predicted outer membrane repeat protein